MLWSSMAWRCSTSSRPSGGGEPVAEPVQALHDRQVSLAASRRARSSRRRRTRPDLPHRHRSRATLRGHDTAGLSSRRARGPAIQPLPADDPELLDLDLRELRRHWAAAAAGRR